MIKFIEFDSFDDYGQHIIPVNTSHSLTKTAASYSPELMKVILNMRRRPDRYYVVINALGSLEYWGPNRNGDGFPESGLMHKSLRTDMGGVNDYGYKTFEYYAKLYRHHANKDPNNSFGEVIFAHWNPVLHRVELIVAINVENAKDIIDSIEKNEIVSVSMGCKVKYDLCCICQQKAKTREEYCIHLKNYLGEIINKDLAQKWSIETGRTIMLGTQVYAVNDYPRFFDISRVYVGADRTAFMLGKAASKGKATSSLALAEAAGVTDSMIDKIAIVGKEADIDKEFGSLGPNDVDGTMAHIKEVDAIRKAMDERANKVIAVEPQIPSEILNSVASAMPLNSIFSTMLGLGIQPKPVEFQRIVLVRVGQKDLADDLESNNILLPFDNEQVSPAPMDVSNTNLVDALGKIFAQYLSQRSSYPSFLMQREKTAADNSVLQTMTTPQLLGIEKKPMTVANQIPLSALTGMAALYAGLKLKALGYTPAMLAEIFVNKPWLRDIVGGSVLFKIYSEIDKNKTDNKVFAPASVYKDLLSNTNFSGQVKTSSYNAVLSSIIYPSIYTLNSWSQRPTCEVSKNTFGMLKTASNKEAVIKRAISVLSSLKIVL